MLIDEFKTFERQYRKLPVIFFFKVEGHNNRNDFDGLTREECMEKAFCAIPITDFDTDWNDTDDNGTHIPNPYETWCYVSMP